MSQLKLYGIPGSRALRSLWAIEECGVDYDHVATSYMEDSKTDEYLAINPNGKVPALVDDDLILFESMAINLYLARHYGGTLYPDNPADEARAEQWSVWAISEIEPPQMEIVVHEFFTPEDRKDEATPRRAGKKLVRPLTVLNQHLDGRDWLVGNAFSIADLNLAAVMLLLKMVKFDYSAYEHVQRWADACYARPALARAEQAGA